MKTELLSSGNWNNLQLSEWPVSTFYAPVVFTPHALWPSTWTISGCKDVQTSLIISVCVNADSAWILSRVFLLCGFLHC